MCVITYQACGNPRCAFVFFVFGIELMISLFSCFVIENIELIEKLWAFVLLIVLSQIRSQSLIPV